MTLSFELPKMSVMQNQAHYFLECLRPENKSMLVQVNSHNFEGDECTAVKGTRGITLLEDMRVEIGRMSVHAFFQQVLLAELPKMGVLHA